MNGLIALLFHPIGKLLLRYRYLGFKSDSVPNRLPDVFPQYRGHAPCSNLGSHTPGFQYLKNVQQKEGLKLSVQGYIDVLMLPLLSRKMKGAKTKYIYI